MTSSETSPPRRVASPGGPVRLRAATAADEPRIKSLVKAAEINPFGLDWRRFTVAEAETGEVVGCGQLKPHKEGVLELASLVVDERWRGRGLGGELIETLVARTADPVWLMCRSSLVPLYEKFAFEEIPMEAEQPAYFARVRRLADIYHWLRGTGEYLAVMVRRPTA